MKDQMEYAIGTIRWQISQKLQELNRKAKRVNLNC